VDACVHACRARRRRLRDETQHITSLFVLATATVLWPLAAGAPIRFRASASTTGCPAPAPAPSRRLSSTGACADSGTSAGSVPAPTPAPRPAPVPAPTPTSCATPAPPPRSSDDSFHLHFSECNHDLRVFRAGQVGGPRNAFGSSVGRAHGRAAAHRTGRQRREQQRHGRARRSLDIAVGNRLLPGASQMVGALGPVPRRLRDPASRRDWNWAW